MAQGGGGNASKDGVGHVFDDCFGFIGDGSVYRRGHLEGQRVPLKRADRLKAKSPFLGHPKAKFFGENQKERQKHGKTPKRGHF
jgi:hypothetical protein